MSNPIAQRIRDRNTPYGWLGLVDTAAAEIDRLESRVEALTNARNNLKAEVERLRNLIDHLSRQEPVMELDDANAAMDVLADRCNTLISQVTLVGPLSDGSIDLAAVETLAKRMRVQADAIDAAVASAKSAEGI